MAEAGDQEFAELLGFLADAKPEVQRFAAEGVLDQTDSKDFLDYCRRHPRPCAKPLLRLVERSEAETAAKSSAIEGAKDDKAARAAATEAATAGAAGSAALQALVNLSSVPTVLEELVELGAPRRCAEALRSGWLEGRAELAHWYAMLLANLTTSQAGRESICSEEPLVRFLLAAYVAKPRPPPRDGYNDPLICLGKALGNICALPEGRRLLAGGEAGPAALTTLLGELGERGRRADVLSAVRNICLDTECHKAVLATDILERLALFLYPLQKVDAALREQLPEELRAALAEGGAALTGDAAVRHAAAVALLGVCRSEEGRGFLRERGCAEVVRAWREEETEEDTRGVLEALVPSVTLSEAELAAQRQEQQRLADSAAAAAPAAALVSAAPAPEAAPAPAPSPAPQAAPAAQAAPEDAAAQAGKAGGPSDDKGSEKLSGLFDDVD